MLPAVCASKALRPSASLVEDLEISFVVETTQKMVAITRLEVAEQHAGFPLVRPLRDVLRKHELLFVGAHFLVPDVEQILVVFQD